MMIYVWSSRVLTGCEAEVVPQELTLINIAATSLNQPWRCLKKTRCEEQQFSLLESPIA
jgi:hypothetical protein